MNICFVAHFAYGALTGDPTGHVGGVERQTALMAHWLAARGHRVSVCTWEEGPEGDEEHAGVRIVKICKPDAGLPGLRFFHPRWSGLRAALARADAGIYYQNCAESVTGQVALWARRQHRQFVFSVASDPECDPALPILESLRERWLYRRGLSLADRVITQTEHQRTMLRDGFSREATMLPMPCDIATGVAADRLGVQRSELPSVLWVGRIAPVKQVDQYIDIARRLPGITFHLVGGADQDPAYAARMLEAAGRLPNMVVHGRLDRCAVFQLYRSSWLLCCTSLHEGFPNTFLEAWAHGLPVISTVDPDGLLERRALGRHCADATAFAQVIREFTADRAILEDCAVRAHAYYHDTHHIERAMPRFEHLLDSLGPAR